MFSLFYRKIARILTQFVAWMATFILADVMRIATMLRSITWGCVVDLPLIIAKMLCVLICPMKVVTIMGLYPLEPVVLSVVRINKTQCKPCTCALTNECPDVQQYVLYTANHANLYQLFSPCHSEQVAWLRYYLILTTYIVLLSILNYLKFPSKSSFKN